ncbi:hypothetical protein C8J57DRAFT_559916 [Mycena rebaudengoi]|nr:hypothetical protein C8J57DRAFT_559916 [Mycena rebaudengoi]
MVYRCTPSSRCATRRRRHAPRRPAHPRARHPCTPRIQAPPRELLVTRLTSQHLVPHELQLHQADGNDEAVGRPPRATPASSSYYLVGLQGDGLFFLDSQHSRPAIPLHPPPTASPQFAPSTKSELSTSRGDRRHTQGLLSRGTRRAQPAER